jgi:hypothetical protein
MLVTSRPLRYNKRMAKRRKNPYAVALGRKGGLKGGPARAANLTPEQRSESARSAVLARWAKERASENARNKKNDKTSGVRRSRD